jgi:hypothetical protein
MIRYASDTNKFEVYEGGAWTNVIGGNAATVTTNANLTGPITSVGNATSITNASIDLTTKVTGILPLANGGTGSATQNFVDLTTAQTIAGVKTFSSTIAGSISGNAATVTTNANLTGPITSVGNTTAVASQTGTGSNFVMDNSPTLITPNLGTPSVLVGTNISGTAANLTAGHVTTNANLTGPITSVGNATSIGSQTGSGSKFVMDTAPTIANPIITNIAPAADFTLTQNTNVVPFTSVNASAVANTLYLKAGQVGMGTATPTAGTRLDITGTGAALSSIIIPRDTVANRPTIGVNGMIRYASDTNKFEVYEGGAWTNVIGGNASTVTTNANMTGDVTSVGNATTVIGINGTLLSGLATGILKNTTTTGAPAIAVAGTDYLVPTGIASTLTNTTIDTTGITYANHALASGNALSVIFNKIAFDQTDYISKSATSAVNGTLAINTLTGNLTVPYAPFGANSAVNQQYVLDLLSKSGAVTTTSTGSSISNASTSATASIVKTGLDVQSTGVWSGATATNVGLNVNVSGGTTNYAGLFNGGNVGIGTTAPAAKFEVHEADGTTVVDSVRLSRNSGGAVAPAAAEMTLSTSRGTTAVPTALQSGDPSGSIDFQGYDGAAIGDGAEIAAFTSGIWSNTSHPTDIKFSTVPTGFTTLAERMRITSEGNVGIGGTPTAKFDVQNFSATTTGNVGAFWNIQTNPTTTGLSSIYASNRVSYTANSGVTSYSLSAAALPVVSTGVAATGANVGLRTSAYRNGLASEGNGTLTWLMGTQVEYGHSNSSAAVPVTTAAAGIYIKPTIQTGTIASMYDIFIAPDITGGTVTNRYGIYQSSANNNYFAGNVGIGGTPTAKLDVQNFSATATNNVSAFWNIQSDPTTGLSSIYASNRVSYTVNSAIASYSLSAATLPAVSTGATATGSNVGLRTTAYRNGVASEGNGTLTWLMGTQVEYGHSNSSAAVPVTTAAAGIYIKPTIQTGTIASMYDIFIAPDITGGTVTTRYGIYQSSANNNYFAGNVGIGTTAPAQKLNVSDGTVTYAVSPSTAGSAIWSGPVTANTANAFMYNAAVEGMRIHTNGNVGIGITNPSYTLHVNGSVAGTSAYNNLSDERFKKNITVIPNALEKLLSLDGVFYHFKIDEFPDRKFSNRREMGVIAQKVEKVFPEAVSKDNKGFRSVSYSMLIAPMIEAFKEIKTLLIGHDKILETQARRIASLEEANRKLQKENSETKARLDKIEKSLNSKK